MGSWKTRSLIAGACVLAVPGIVLAQDGGAPAVDPAIVRAEPIVGEKIGVSLGYDYASHFMLYGADVWGAGNDFFSSRSTNFVWVDVAVDLAPFTLNFGAWSDINDNADSGLGGAIQEVDVYVGLSYTIERFTLGVTYQEWYYGGDEERVVDLSVAFDDSDLLFDGFAFNPAFLAHLRVDGASGQEEAEAFVFSIEPAFQLTEGEYALTLSIPAGVGFFTDEFNGGDDGFGYAYVGATLSVPLAFIPAEYGEWSAAVNLTYYFTDDDAIPGNPDDDFLTGTLSISTSF